MPKRFVKKSIEINAHASRVWDAITNSVNSDQWAFEFSSGGPKFHIESEWVIGGSVLWKNEDGDVIVEGNVTAVERNKLLRFTVFDVRYEKPPVTDKDGITFELKENKGKTLLKISQGDFSVLSEGKKFQTITEQTWERVLPKIKELAESKK